MLKILIIILFISDIYVVGMIVKTAFCAIMEKTQKAQIVGNILGLVAGLGYSIGLGSALIHNKIDGNLGIILMFAPVVIMILAAIILPSKK